MALFFISGRETINRKSAEKHLKNAESKRY